MIKEFCAMLLYYSCFSLVVVIAIGGVFAAITWGSPRVKVFLPSFIWCLGIFGFGLLYMDDFFLWWHPIPLILTLWWVARDYCERPVTKPVPSIDLWFIAVMKATAVMIVFGIIFFTTAYVENPHHHHT